MNLVSVPPARALLPRPHPLSPTMCKTIPISVIIVYVTSGRVFSAPCRPQDTMYAIHHPRTACCCCCYGSCFYCCWWTSVAGIISRFPLSLLRSICAFRRPSSKGRSRERPDKDNNDHSRHQQRQQQPAGELGGGIRSVAYKLGTENRM